MNWKGKILNQYFRKIVEQYSKTDEDLKEKYEEIKNVILEEEKIIKKQLIRQKISFLKNINTG